MNALPETIDKLNQKILTLLESSPTHNAEAIANLSAAIKNLSEASQNLKSSQSKQIQLSSDTNFIWTEATEEKVKQCVGEAIGELVGKARRVGYGESAEASLRGS